MPLPIGILPQQRGAGEEFGQAFGSTFVPGFQQALENKEMKNALARLSPDSSPQEKAQAVQGLNISPEKKQQALKGFEALALLEQRQQQQQFKEDQALVEQDQQMAEGAILEKRAAGEPLTAEDWQGLSPTTRRALVNAEAQQPVFEKESEKLQAKSSNEFYSKVQGAGEKARKQLTEVRIAKDLNNQEISGLNARNKAADIFGEWVRDPKAVEFRARSKQFMEGIKELIGGRITEFEFKFFQDMFPNLSQSKAANEALLGMVEIRENANLEEAKIANQIVKENGGRVPPDLQARVSDKMDSYMDDQVGKWRKKAYASKLKEDPPPKGKIAVLNPNGQYGFIPNGQAKAWQDAGGVVIGR